MSPPIYEQLSALMEANGKQMGQGGAFTLTLATVKDINDDKKLNRVKCLPIGAPDDEMTDWCYVMSPMGGKDRGLFLFPQVDDLVVLGYLESDPHRPIVLGSFWNTTSTAPLKVEDNKAEDYCLKTPNSVDLSLHDESGKQKLTITMPSGIVVEIDDDKKTVTTKNKGDDTSLLMKMQDGEIEIKAKSKIKLTAGQSNIELDQSGKITIKGSDKISIEGMSIDIKATGQMNLEGMDVTVKANKDVNVTATANTNVKGLMINLN